MSTAHFLVADGAAMNRSLLLLGFTPAQGNGIVITINANDDGGSVNTSARYRSKLRHGRVSFSMKIDGKLKDSDLECCSWYKPVLNSHCPWCRIVSAG